VKIAWWMYGNTDDSVFTRNAPKLALSVLDELRRRGHEIVLNGIARPPDGSNVDTFDYQDTGRYASAWNGEGLWLHRVILDLIKETRGCDPQNRAQRRLKAWLESSEFKPLEADVQCLKINPCVSLAAKLEVTAVILRAVVSGVPVILFDQDLGANGLLPCLDDMFRLTGAIRDATRADFVSYFYLFTPYLARLWAGHQYVSLPPYQTPPDRAIDTSRVEYDFGYVGNDYERDQFLAEFYKREHANGATVRNAVWGRWDLERHAHLLDSVGAEAFLGPVPPRDILSSYQRCWASIVITHRKFYPAKLIAFRWCEVAEAGRLMFVDARLRNDLELVDEKYYVEAPEPARQLIQRCRYGAEYIERVWLQREQLAGHHLLKPSRVPDSIEAVVTKDDFNWQAPELGRRHVFDWRELL